MTISPGLQFDHYEILALLGKLDYRSDIFSFRIILYEMLSGQRTFTGESQVEVT